MFTREDSKSSPQLSANNSQYMDRMALFQVGQKRNFPSDRSPFFTTQRSGLGGGPLKPQPSPPYYSQILPAKSDMPCGVGVNNKPVVDLPPQKRFLIFDSSYDRTRLFYGPSLLAPVDWAITSKNPTDGDSKGTEAQMGPHFSVNEEKWDENHVPGEESEMREDTEEINALLYSDSYDDDDYDSDEDDDEVIGPITDPSLTKEDKVRNGEGFIEEVGSSYDSRKRQRLLDGNDKQSLFETSGTLMEIREKEVKIHKALHVLSKMIPGLKNKNPLSVFDDSIVYLESMKAEAEALGLGCVESELPSYP